MKKTTIFLLLSALFLTATLALAASLSGAFHDGTPRPMAVVMGLAVIGSAVALRVLALPKSTQS